LIILVIILVVLFWALRSRNKRINAEVELRKLNDSLEQRVAERTHELEMINKELAFHLSEIEQFTYIASHDLQEPLRTLSNFTQLVKEEYAGKLDDDGNKYIDFISTSANRMRSIVKDLLDYSLLGKDSVKSNIDCTSLVNSVLADMAGLIRSADAHFTVKDLPTLTGYENELRLMLQHLISNALKFRKKEVRPEITLSCANTGKDWEFSMADNGIGLDPRHHKKIFSIYKRLHNRNDYDGSGIGLAYCKKIAELHGGRIWVEPNESGGSTFKFTIPVTG
jgi:light-regulated signal transduction histidine kinase (bacteriophytochrome)